MGDTGSIAQLVEHSAVNRKVVGSIPTGIVVISFDLKLLWLSWLEHRAYNAEIVGSIPTKSN